MTRLFEPISVSAVHIYHSALELSPLSSIVRRLYYHRRHTPFPRVVIGTMDSWDQSMHLSGVSPYRSCTWSPCGQFVAASSREGVEIRDALSSELVSTLTESDVYPGCGLAYSPDGRSLACHSYSLIILDIQTGGVAKRIRRGLYGNSSIVWSLDGRKIGTVLQNNSSGDSYRLYVYDLASGTTWSPGSLESRDKPHLWAHDNSFRIMASRLNSGDVVVIETFEVGFYLTEIESFRLKLRQCDQMIVSFSPTTYRVSIRGPSQFYISDVRSSECLLEGEGRFLSHCFSSDGCLFAASLQESIWIWRYTSDRYAPWREFPSQGSSSWVSPLQFSPTSSSILRHFRDFLQVFRLDGSPVFACPNRNAPRAVLSPFGAYMATTHACERTVGITNPFSQSASQFIDTGMNVGGLALTGNILLVHDTNVIAAWRLTEGGLVDGVFGDRRAGHSDSIWSVSVPLTPEFRVNGQTVTVKQRKNDHVYHTGTGKVLEPTQTPAHSRGRRYDFQDMYFGRHYTHRRGLDRQGVLSGNNWPVSLATLQEGWVRDPEGKHRLWIPVEWRTPLYSSGWFSNIKTLQLNFHNPRIVIIMF